MRHFVLMPVAALLGFAACGVPSPPPPPLQPRAVLELARWQALDGGELLGQLVLLEIRDPAGPVRFYQIEDAAGRLVGSATEAGRFSRRVPFREEEEDLGVWRPERGVGELFGRHRSVELRNLPVEAGARRQ
ncbi:MAG: hypothetical protein KDC98_26770 [Planctomycetes bacterium]|nr:hypothetical protein [Planctomycetota bacterium]